jgi:hypothetical protein
MGIKEKLGLKENFKLWGLKKISWRTTGVQNLVLHPLVTITCITPLVAFQAVAWPLWPAAAWAGLVSGGYHEWTQFLSRPPPKPCKQCETVQGGRNLNLLERGIDVLGHAAIPTLIVGLLEVLGIL